MSSFAVTLYSCTSNLRRSEESYKRGKLNSSKLEELKLFYFPRRVILNMIVTRMYLILKEDFCK